MPEIYTVSVQTADGKCLIQEKITCDSDSLYWELSQLFSRLWYQYGGSLKSETLPGSGIGPSVPDSSSPTES